MVEASGPFRSTKQPCAFALSATRDSLPLESCSNTAQNRKVEVLPQEQMGTAVLQKGGQLGSCGNRNFNGDFVNSLFSAFRL